MTSNIKVVDIQEAKQETNNETVEPVQEEEPNNEPAIENVVEPTEEIANEPPEVKPEPKKKEPSIPLDQPVKQNVRQQDKLVKCPKCDKQMKLKSYRYRHETTCKGKLEEIPRKPKAMPKPKVQPVMQQTVQEPVQHTVQHVQQPAQPIQNQIIQPSNRLTDMTHHYQLLQNQYIQQKKEKYNNLCQSMFSTKSKKR